MLLSNYLWVYFLLLTVALSAQSQSGTDCGSICGNITVEYPFGTTLECSHDANFLVRCDQHKLFIKRSNLEVLRISFDGELEVLMNVNIFCQDVNRGYYDLKSPGFEFSIKNQLFLVGCDAAIYYGSPTRFGYSEAACETRCDSLPPRDDSCSGSGCCHSSISTLGRELRVLTKISHVPEYPCTYFFIVKEGYFKFSPSEDLKNLRNITRFPVLLDWTMSGRCKPAERTRVCGENSNCTSTTTGESGYSCKCLHGFEGNPYVQHGCKDIDECKMNIHSCGKDETCKNVIGSFRCKNKTEWKTIILVSVIGFLLFVIGVCCLMLKLNVRKRAKLREQRFEENGGILLVQLLDSGAESLSSESFKIFKEKEIKTATKGYHETRILGEGGQGIVYKGILSDSVEVAIKKSRVGDRNQVGQFINELVLVSQINHPNVVRLLGCCLETQVPFLIYEFVSGGTLFENLFGSSLPWSDRVRIAAEIAETLKYLHFSAPVPIVHRDIKPANILLSANLSAKLSDFGASRRVPADSEQLTTLVQGTLGYLDPEYMHTSILSEKSDVYSFGVVLMELVSGKKALCFNRPQAQKNLVSHIESALRENRLSEVMDQRVVNAENHGEIYQAALLAIKCTRVKGEERPDMRQVAAELQGLIASGPSVSGFESN